LIFRGTGRKINRPRLSYDKKPGEALRLTGGAPPGASPLSLMVREYVISLELGCNRLYFFAKNYLWTAPDTPHQWSLAAGRGRITE
jgi:hypothetical protein